jgi:hypothetical protein
MDNITPRQAMQLIDIAANENRLYHYNGGQAYIRVSMDTNILMIIDHTGMKMSVYLHDGTKYFQDYKDYNESCSERLREYGSLSQWYAKRHAHLKHSTSTFWAYPDELEPV